ncbi:hypothetical protein PH5382_02106 [Phaeobacter sp. CECT 5382]|uniref:hypothetical protein n=1 Tax=Rhodobacterales TaxID=204455 RepID=UPI0006D99C39|nr:hypothetical protein [Phaeobacter sp. CECT 5382]CUH88174.1 hypothetical protein PH5382_02106 [Phaeobacter sp. CECT 5382]
MDSDLALILGLLFAGLSVPSILSAFSENRPPRISAVMLLLGSGLIAYAMLSQPGGYRLEQIPDVFFSVLARII